MRRRDFLGVIGGAAAWPVVAQAQKPALRIGFLSSGAANSFVALTRSRAIREGLRDNGLIDGRDYTIEARFAAGHYERFPELAKELAQAGVSVILTIPLRLCALRSASFRRCQSSCFRSMTR